MKTNRHLKIFISSTFEDMQKEREVLLKEIFLELKKIAKERFVEITEIDLRVGITKEQAENGKIVKVCLDEIKRCEDSPIFFLGILGNRYGSIDWFDSVDKNILKDNNYKWIKQFFDVSITELEIISAIEKNSKHNRAFIYTKEGVDDNKRLINLKNRLKKASKTNNKLFVSDYKDITDFRKKTINSFTKALDELYPKDEKISEVERLRASHKIFAKSRQKIYIPHKKNESIIDEFIESNQDRLLLYGESGLGKSALIANYFDKFKDKNDYFVIEHYIGGAGELSNDLHQMLRRIMLEIKEEFELTDEVPREPQKVMNEFAFWLYSVKRPTIIVLDGYNQIEDELKENLFDYIPEKLEHVKLIITSTKKSYPIENSHQIEPLSQEEQKELIIDYLKQYGKKGVALEIKENLVKHPKTNNTLFLRTLLNEIRLLGNFDNLQNDIENYLTTKDVVELFIKIFERLERDYRENLAKEVLSLLYVSRDGLSEDNLMEIINQNTTQKLTRLEFSPLFLAIDEHLINRDGLYGFFHEYIRLAVKNRYLNEKELIDIERKKIADYFERREIDNQRIRELPFQLVELKDRRKLYNCLIEIEFFIAIQDKDKYELLKYVQFLYDQVSFFNELEYKSFQKNIKINNLLRLTDFYIHIYQVDTNRTIDFAKKVLQFIDNNYADQNESLISCYNNLGMAYMSVSYEKAIKYFHKSIDLVANRKKVIYLYHNLARAYRKNSEHQKALNLYHKVISDKIEFFGEDSLEVASTFFDISEVYKEIGDYENSLKYLKKSLQLKEKYLGKKHIETSIIYASLGVLYKDLGKYKMSLDFIKRALLIQKEIYRENHPELLITYSILAENYMAIGKTDKALKIYETIISKKGDNYTLDNLRFFNNLAEVYRERKDYDKAIKIHKKVLKYRLKLLDENHLDTLSSYNNLGLSYYEIGNMKESQKLYEKALSISLKKYKNTKDTVLLLYNLSGIYSNLGNYWRALSLINQSLEIAKKLFDKNHPYIANIHNTLGVYYAEMKYYDQGLFELKKALKIRLEKLGINHPDTQSTILSIKNLKSLKAEKVLKDLINDMLNKD